MRTKTIILSAVALAAGVLSSQAQVYSANVVGYANIVAPVGFSAEANVFSVPGDYATNVFPNTTGQYDGIQLLIFNPLTSKYGAPANFFSSAQLTGFEDSSANPLPTPLLKVGAGFLIGNANGAFTNTQVGSVLGWNSGTLTFSNGIVIPSGLSLVSSPLPIAGALSHALQLTNVAGSLNGLAIYTVNGTASLNPILFFDNGVTSGFSDVGGTEKPEPVFAVGESFYFLNSIAPTIPWNQKL